MTFIVFAKYNQEIYFRSNVLVLLHVKRTQFLMDHLKDPILSSVCGRWG